MFSKLYFNFKLALIKFILKKDIMETKIKYYRNQGVKIGNNVRTFSHLISSEPYLLEIGDNVTISINVQFITHDNSATKVIENSTDLVGRIKIGNNCFIGQNSIILPGVQIGDNVIVGSGSVVTKSFLKEGVIIGGNPAKVIGDVGRYREKYKGYAFNALGLNYLERKELFLSNEQKLIKK